MIIKSNPVKIQYKNILEGISKKTNNPYKLNVLYVEDNGVTHNIMANANIYEKAEKDKTYCLKYYVDPYGRITLNDIEPAK